MNAKKMKELMIDYVEGQLDGELKEFVEKQMSKRQEIREEVQVIKQGMKLMQSNIDLEPESTLRLNFDKMLKDEMEKESVGTVTKGSKVINMHYLPRIAAALALLISGAFIGWWITTSNDNTDELNAIKKEMEETRKLVIESLNNETSASTRLYGVNVAYTGTGADSEITEVLIKTMHEDENTNVRLAAARALLKFSEHPKARRALIDGIATQTDPVVQIELINIMVELKETGALEKLKEVINDDTSLETVKDEAHMAVFKLS